MTITQEQLETAKLAVEQTRGPYDEALKARRALVKQALEQGMKAAHIARHAGLSREAVGKLR